MFKKIIDYFHSLFMPLSLLWICRRIYHKNHAARIADIENTYRAEIAYLTGLACKGGNIEEGFKDILPKITELNTPGLLSVYVCGYNSQTMSEHPPAKSEEIRSSSIERPKENKSVGPGHHFAELEDAQFDSIGGPEDNKSAGIGTVNIRGRGRIKALLYHAIIHDGNSTGEIMLMVEDNVENASNETARLALSNQHKRYAIKISGWIMLLLGLIIVLMSREIVFPGLERLLGIETIVGAKNVVYSGNGDYYYTNPGAMIRWIAATAATGVSIAVIGAIILIRVKKKHKKQHPRADY